MQEVIAAIIFGALPVIPEISFLRANPPVALPVVIEVRNDNPAEVLLVKNQTAALIRLAGTSSPVMASTVIPFLDYPASPDINYLTPSTKRRSLDDLEAHWPAFAVLLKDRHASPNLAAYILDGRNPIDLRLSAWLVLRYVDRSAFEGFSNMFVSDLKSAKPSYRAYVSAIIRGQVDFDGVKHPEDW